MAIHEQKFSEYQSYPGRQIEYVVVPRRYPHYFFEGVQSVDATANSDEINHGQFGFKSDVIIDREYKNTTGTISLKEFNNASYVLRGMAGVDPATSFVFDPSRLEHVDVCANVYNKARNKVLRSTWLVDFTPSLSENESLDDIQTKDLSYTAIRKIDFEGYQIVHQEWLDGVKGQKDFTLRYPAVIDPVLVDARQDENDLIVGKTRHDLCPIQFMLRVIVDGKVLDDATNATVTTAKDGDVIQSVLHLTDGLTDDNVPVIAFWLSDGNTPYGQVAVTSAPVITGIQFIDSGVDAQWNTSDDLLNVFQADATEFDTPTGGETWNGLVRVRWSESLASNCLADLDMANNKFGNFTLNASVYTWNTGTQAYDYNQSYDFGSPTQIGNGDATQSQQATFDFTGRPEDANVISRNQLVMQFDATQANTLFSAVSGQRAKIIWTLQYVAIGSVLPIYGEDTKKKTPMHTVMFQTTPEGTSRIYK